MIFTNEKAFENVEVLSKLDEKGMLGYAISRNRHKLTAELQDYFSKRDELLKEHGKDIGQGRFELQPEDAAAFVSELRPFNELTVDVDVMQITPDVFYSGNLTSSQMFILDWMVKDGDMI